MALSYSGCVESIVNKHLYTFLFLGVLLSGCQFIGTIYTAGHKVGSVLLDDRSLSDDLSDTRINMEIRDTLARTDIKYAVDIEITVFEGAVLLNGALPTVELIDEVVQTVWRINGVQKVYNYIRVSPPPSLDVVNEDAAISAKIRYELSLTRHVSSVNYKITMENGTVYILGIAENKAELERVVAVIKNTVNVHRVIILVRYKSKENNSTENSA